MALVHEAMQELQEKEPQEAMESTDDDSDLPELYDAECSPSVKAAPQQEVREVLRRYGEKFGESRDGSAQGYNRRAFPWYCGESFSDKKELAAEDLQAVLRGKEKRQAKLWNVDSDGEQITLCAHCMLPVGEVSYSGQGKATPLHGECAAQLMLQDMKAKDAKRVQEESEKKQISREEHGIGQFSVPLNLNTAGRLKCSPVPQGLCCLVWDEAARSVQIKATAEPTAGVNLEYLMLALKVRYHACREPLFSLDPVNPENLEKTMLEKRFSPSWLAGTSVGELMFQADYYLKELAVGEHSMPVLGMMSVFDWSEVDNVKNGWTGREWFVVNKAEVKLAADNTLIPCVKMGVEARQQVCRDGTLEDAAITSKNHPLRKFAESFSKNFDLIAERQQLIFQLRELAKASTLAKFLVDSGTSVPQEWWQLADELVESAKTVEKQMTQLWNMRGQSRIQVRDGKMINSKTGQCYLTSIYGGIEFGLDRFELASRHTLRPVGAGGSTMVGGLQGMQLGPTARPGFAPSRFQLTQRPAAPAPAEQPQGVDLCLDDFDLSAPERFAHQASCSASLDSPEARVPLGRAFLANLQSLQVKQEDRQLFQNLFQEKLSDRLAEADAFVPPDPDLKYVSKLRALVCEEDLLRQKRRALFCDSSFLAEEPGSAFPRAWTSNFQLEQEGISAGATKKALKSGLVQLAGDAEFRSLLAKEVLPETAAAYEQSSEDGAIFRIYRFGGIEVRTIQEVKGRENIVATFSSRATTWGVRKGGKEISDSERVVSAKMYVEAVDSMSSLRSCGDLEENAPWRSQSMDHCHYFLVLETDQGTSLVAEKLADGSATLVEPDRVEERISLARLLYSHQSQEKPVSLREVKLLQGSSARVTLQGATASARKLYVKNLFKLVSGKAWLVRKAKGAGKGKPSEPVRVPHAVPAAETRRTYSRKVNYEVTAASK